MGVCVLGLQAEKPLGSEPWFNPEDVTQQKVCCRSPGHVVWMAACLAMHMQMRPAGTYLPVCASKAGIGGQHRFYVLERRPAQRMLNVWVVVLKDLLCSGLQRDWIETQGESSKPQLSWPQHIYEHLVIVVGAASGLCS